MSKTVNCLECRKPFVPTCGNWDSKGQRQCYCSRRCQLRAWVRRRSALRSARRRKAGLEGKRP